MPKQMCRSKCVEAIGQTGVVPPRMYTRIAVLLLVCLFAVNIYRAATQALTVDEAFTYHLYLSKDLHTILNDYNANDHVLFTLLAKWSVNHFGNSEFAIRLPSLLGGLLYLVVVYRLSKMLFGSGWLFLLAVAILTMNPFILDFLSIGRGYGMALAFWMYALYCCFRFRQEDDPKYLVRAGVATGLAIAANLTLLFPSLALLAVMGLRYIRQPWRIIDRLLIPAVVTAFIFLVIPLTHVTTNAFYVGVTTLREALEIIVSACFTAKSTMIQPVQDWILYMAVPLVAVVLVFCLLAIKWRDEQAMGIAAILAFALVQIVAAHRFAGLLYPYRRTGLYLVPIFTLLWLLAVRDIDRWPRVQILAAVPLFLCVALFAMQASVTTYDEWAFCGSSKKVAALLNQDGARRVGASWFLEQSLNYYRDRLPISSMQPVTRAPLDLDYDHFVLLPNDYEVVQKRGLKVVFKDEESGVLLAVPQTH